MKQTTCRKLLYTISFLFIAICVKSQVLVIGPSLHYNMGGGDKKFSWGVEISYWQWEDFYYDFTPLGIDIGIEFEKSKTRIYSELQAGLGYGASAGYVYEFGKDFNGGGFQGSVWGAYYGGIDVRYRRINNTNYFSPGSFAKVPLYARTPSMNMNIFGNMI